MGTDYYPRSIIGVRLNWNKFFIREHSVVVIPYIQLPKRHRDSCSTDRSRLNTNGQDLPHKDLPHYCPECGCALKKKHTEIIALIPEVISEHDLLYELDSDTKFREWNITQVGDVGDDHSYIFIGFNFIYDVAYDGVMSHIDVTTLTGKKEKLEADLEEFGLWDKDAFGLWSFVHVSY